jgi:hypothetical protein
MVCALFHRNPIDPSLRLLTLDSLPVPRVAPGTGSISYHETLPSGAAIVLSSGNLYSSGAASFI